MTLSGGFDAYAANASSVECHSLRRLRAARARKKSSCGGSGCSDGKMIGSYAQMRANVPGRLCSPRISAAPPFEWPHATSAGSPARPRCSATATHVVGEPVPRVVDVGRVAVAVAAEVERPDAAPVRDQSFRDRCPHAAVKSGRVREQHRRAARRPSRGRRGGCRPRRSCAMRETAVTTAAQLVGCLLVGVVGDRLHDRVGRPVDELAAAAR